MYHNYNWNNWNRFLLKDKIVFYCPSVLEETLWFGVYFFEFGMDPLVKIDGIMDRFVCRNILENHMLSL